MGIISPLNSCNFCLRIDLEKTFFQHIYFGFPYGKRRGWKLTVDICSAYAVGIDKGQVIDAAAYQTFGTPATYSSNPQQDHSCGIHVPHRIRTDQ